MNQAKQVRSQAQEDTTLSEGLVLLNDHHVGHLNALKASIYWKDTKGKYLDANDQLFETTGLQSYNELLGATDREMSWSEEADTIIENDKRVIADNHSIALVERVLGNQDWLSYKSPLLNREGKVIGLMGISSLIDQTSTLLDFADEVMFFAGRKASEMLRNIMIQYRRKALGLSPRQLECLMFLSQGLSYKHIAKRLSISDRTVQNHIALAKDKLNCYTRYELIQKAREIWGR